MLLAITLCACALFLVLAKFLPERSYLQHGKSLPLIFLPIMLAGLLLSQQVGYASAEQFNAIVQLPTNEQTSISSVEMGTVDPVPPRFQQGQRLYLESCATCHLAIPPAVFPSETWRRLLQDTQHYGVTLQPLIDPPRLIIWSYLRHYSRALLAEETIPYRFSSSRYMKALHPRVDLSRPLTMNSCKTCHPASSQFNFRRLTPQWENAP